MKKNLIFYVFSAIFITLLFFGLNGQAHDSSGDRLEDRFREFIASSEQEVHATKIFQENSELYDTVCFFADYHSQTDLAERLFNKEFEGYEIEQADNNAIYTLSNQNNTSDLKVFQLRRNFFRSKDAEHTLTFDNKDKKYTQFYGCSPYKKAVFIKVNRSNVRDKAISSLVLTVK